MTFLLYSLDSLDSLPEIDPAAAVALDHLDLVGDGLEHPTETDLRPLVGKLATQALALERPDCEAEAVVVEANGDGDLAIGPGEKPLERDLDVLEVLESEVQPYRQPAENKVGDVVEPLFVGQREDDLV